MVIPLFFLFLVPASAEAPQNEKELTWMDTVVFQVYVPTPIIFPALKSTYCSCVLYAKAVLKRSDEVWGNAKDIKPQKTYPEIGDVIVLTDGGGHVGVVIETTASTVTFTEANYKSCQKGERTLERTDKRIKGYF